MYYMLFLIILLLILFIYLFNSQTIENFQSSKNKMMIFVAEWCPACQNYKKNTHSSIVRDLSNENIDFVFVENTPSNEELFEKYEIKYLPTVVIQNKNGVSKKLNSTITSANIKKLLQ